MRDLLPAIHVNAKNPLNFLKKVGEIALKSKAFLVDHVSSGTTNATNLRYVGTSSHKELGAQFLCFDDTSNKVAVEIRADRWFPDNLPSYDTYVSAAELLIKPILAEYNKDEGVRCRLLIESTKRLEPKIPPLGLRYFDRFSQLANKKMLHPLDWERFYEFVRNARANLSEEDMKYLLVKEGFASAKAEHIANIYRHLREFKKKRTTYVVFQNFHVDGKTIDYFDAKK